VTADEALERARAAAGTSPAMAAQARASSEAGAAPAAVPTPVSAPSERLRLALEQARFVILVQPVVPSANLADDAGEASEGAGWQLGRGEEDPLFAVQLRMVGKDGQLILPRAFIPLAERVGMVQRIDLWVINGLLMHLANERARHAPVGMIARLSPATVADPESLAAIEKSIIATGVPAERLILEISDSPELANLPAALHFIARLRAIGCRFVLNGTDAETGLLPFLHSQRRPGDFVRIERSVVQRVASDSGDLHLVTSITGLAKSLEMRVIAGAVDNEQTLQALRGAGVDYLQGKRLGEARLLKRVDFGKLMALS
jgi:EAL domain-containing protein (putative c-di-GMP-specific phosphodiesterase class I)